jgi:hypothetical protein
MTPGTIEVVDDPQQVAAAKTEYADHRQKKIQELLSDPEKIKSHDQEGLQLLNADRTASVASLIRLRDDNSKSAALRIHAIEALRIFNVPPDFDQLAILGGTNNAARKELLLVLACTDWRRQPVPQPIKSFLIDSVKSSDSQIRRLAANEIGWRKVSEAAATLRSTVRAQAQPELCLLDAAARICASEEILGLLRHHLASETFENRREDVLAAIVQLGASTTDRALREEAVRNCFTYLSEQPDQRSISGNVSEAVEFIAAAGRVESSKAMLQEIVVSSKWKLLKQDALDELAKLDPAVAAKTAAQAGVNRNEKRTGATANVNSRPSSEVAVFLVEYDVLDQMEVERALTRWGAKQQEAKAERGNNNLQDDLDFIGFMALADRLCIINVKSDSYPTRHDLLLLEFAECSAGLFKPEAALQHFVSNLPDEPEDPDQPGRWIPTGIAEYSVQFVHGGKLYRFAPKDQGRWTDIFAVVKAIHRALQDSEVTEQFVPLADTGEMGLFIFGKPDAIRKAAQEFDLPLRDDFTEFLP